MKDKRINVRVAESEKKVLTEIAQKLDIPEALIVREAVKEKLLALAETLNKQTETSLALQS